MDAESAFVSVTRFISLLEDDAVVVVLQELAMIAVAMISTKWVMWFKKFIGSKCSRSLEVTLNIEAGTGFVGKFAVAVKRSPGKLLLQILHELAKCGTLLLCACVFGCFSIGSETTDVADADAVGVMADTMGPYLFEIATLVYGAITIDHEVVAYRAPTACLVPTGNVGYCVILAFAGSGAMDYDLIDAAHDKGLGFIVYGLWIKACPGLCCCGHW